MASDSPTPETVSQEAIDQRLDAVDRLLLGMLPRGERLEFVARLEAAVRKRLTENPAADLGLTDPVSLASVRGVRGGFSRPKRSVAAFAAAVLGIAAVVLLLVGMPLAYVAMAELSSALDIDGPLPAVLFCLTPLAACVAGTAAVVLGMVALVKIARRDGSLVGQGWAVTGLCTGPLPVLCGAMLLLLVGGQLLADSSVGVGVNPVAYAPPVCPNCGPAPIYSAAVVPAPGYVTGPYPPPVCFGPPPSPIEPPPMVPPTAAAQAEVASATASSSPDTITVKVAPTANPLPPVLASAPKPVPLVYVAPLAEGPSTLPPDNQLQATESQDEAETPPTPDAAEEPTAVADDEANTAE